MTDVPLRDYLDHRFDQLQRDIDRRFAESKDAVAAALDSQREQTAAALVAAEKAVDKAEAGASTWRQSANEWRGAMTDRERNFLTRREFYSILGASVAVIGIIEVVTSFT